MNTQAVTDAHGNTLSVVRQIPSFGFDLTVTTKDGTTVTFELAGENLKAVAEKLGGAAAFAETVGR